MRRVFLHRSGRILLVLMALLVNLGFVSLTHDVHAATGQISITEFPVPTSVAGLSGIVAGPDGNLWFTEVFGNRIGSITPEGHVTEYLVPGQYGVGYGIAAGPDGNLWFTATTQTGAAIGKITTSGQITEYPVPSQYGTTNEITLGPDGDLWFTFTQEDMIGKITTSGQVTEYPTPPSYNVPEGITAGPDGNLWFTEPSNNKIGSITTSGQITEYPIPPSGSAPNEITTGPDGNLWFTQSIQIGSITTSGQITEYPAPTNSEPNGITSGPDGNLWFTEYAGNKIGSITPGGQVTEYPVPTLNSAPDQITAGPDGNLWFTENAGNANNIGRVNLSSKCSMGLGSSDTQSRGIPSAKQCNNLWGVDSHSSLIPTKYTKDNLYTEVMQPEPKGYGAIPDFWGRYIGADPTKPDPHSSKHIQYKKDMFPAEVTFAHSVGLAILPIYFNFSAANVTTSVEGQNYAKWAIEDALGRLSISQGAAIFVDIEPDPVSPTSDFIQGWYDQFTTSFTFTYGKQTFKYDAGYYKVGYYGDSNKTSNTKFDSAYCEAVKTKPQIGTNSFIWAIHPSLGLSSKADEPPYAPYKPNCASTTPAWQYGIQPKPPLSPNVDTDEAQQALPLWHP